MWGGGCPFLRIIGLQAYKHMHPISAHNDTNTPESTMSVPTLPTLSCQDLYSLLSSLILHLTATYAKRNTCKDKHKVKEQRAGATDNPIRVNKVGARRGGNIPHGRGILIHELVYLRSMIKEEYKGQQIGESRLRRPATGPGVATEHTLFLYT